MGVQAGCCFWQMGESVVQNTVTGLCLIVVGIKADVVSAVCYGKMTESGRSRVDNLFISQLTDIYVNSHTQRYTSLGSVCGYLICTGCETELLW